MFQFIEISKEYCYLIKNWFTKFFDSIMRKDPIVFYLFIYFFQFTHSNNQPHTNTN